MGDFGLLFLYCLGLRLPLGRVESSIGGEGLRLYEAPSPPIAGSTLRHQKIWGYADGKLHFDFDFRKYCNSDGIKMEKTTDAAALYSDGGCCGTAKLATVCASDNPLIINVRFPDAPTLQCGSNSGGLKVRWCHYIPYLNRIAPTVRPYFVSRNYAGL